jgi:hypothetical protein
VSREDLSPGACGSRGDDLAEGRLLVRAPLLGDRRDLDGTGQPGLAEALEHLLDLAGRVLDPAGAAGGEQQLLLLQLEGQQLQQLSLTPEQRGQLVRAHGASSVRGSSGGAAER